MPLPRRRLPMVNQDQHDIKRQPEEPEKPSDRPNSTLSASDGSDSGCSFGGGVSPVNFGWSMGDGGLSSSRFTERESRLTIPQSPVIVQKVGKGTADAASKWSQVDGSSICSYAASQQQQQQNQQKVAHAHKHSAQEVDQCAFLLHDSATSIMTQSQTEWPTAGEAKMCRQAAALARYQSASEAPTSAATVAALAASLQAFHPATAAVADITQYINPEIHSMHLNATNVSRRPAPKPSPQEMYKTVMCQAWLESTKCLFGENCKFAHGEAELRPARVSNRNNAKYKTKLCEKYTTNGICPYGDRCLFIHPLASSSSVASMVSSPSNSLVTESRHFFANPSFVNPDIHQRAGRRSVAVSGGSAENFDGVDDSDAQSKPTATYFANGSSVESALMLEQNVKRNNPPTASFFKSQSSFFALTTKSLAAQLSAQRAAFLHSATPSRKHSSISATGAAEAAAFSYDANSNLSLWTAGSSSIYDRASDDDNDINSQQQAWPVLKQHAWQDDGGSAAGAQLAEELHAAVRKVSSCSQPSAFLEQHHDRCFTQNEQTLQEMASSLSSISNKLNNVGKQPAGSMLRRLNSAAVIDNITTASSAAAPVSAAPVLQRRSYFDGGSPALGRAESAIWSSDESRFVMGGEPTLMHASVHSRTASDFFGADYDEFLLEGDSKRTLNNKENDVRQLAKAADDNGGDMPYDEVYNTLNPLTLCHKKADLQELMRVFELQKLEEYLIASERKLSLERNRNDFHGYGPFHNIAL